MSVDNDVKRLEALPLWVKAGGAALLLLGLGVGIGASVGDLREFEPRLNEVEVVAGQANVRSLRNEAQLIELGSLEGKVDTIAAIQQRVLCILEVGVIANEDIRECALR